MAARQHLLHLFEVCVQKGLDVQRRRCKEPVSCVDIQLATSLSFIFQVCVSFFVQRFSVTEEGGAGETGGKVDCWRVIGGDALLSKREAERKQPAIWHYVFA